MLVAQLRDPCTCEKRRESTNCADISDSRDKVRGTFQLAPCTMAMQLCKATLRTISEDRGVHYEEVAVYIASSGSR